MEKVVKVCFMPLDPPALIVTNNQTNTNNYCTSNCSTGLSSSTISSMKSLGHHIDTHLLMLLACLIGWLGWTLMKRFAVHHTSYWQRLGVNGPKAEPFVGHLDQLPAITQPFDMSRTLAHFEQWSQENGKVYGLQLGWLNLLMVGDGSVLREVFVDKASCFNKIKILPTRDNPQNIFFSDGDLWKKLHNTALPAFSVNNLKKMIPIFCDSSLQLVKLLKQQIGQENINIQPYMQVLAWQVLSRTALGSRAKTLSEEQLSACSNLAKQVVEEDRRRELPLNGNKWMNKLDRLSLIVPWLSSLFCSIAQWFWMRKQQQMQRVFSLICDHFDQQYGEEDLQGNVEGSSKTLGLKQLFLLDIFPIVASESTSNALSEIFYNLAKNPWAQKMLQEEIDGVVDGDEMPCYEQLGRLKFATAVIKESVRLNPAGIHSGCTTYPISTFLNTRVCIKKTSLGNVDVEPGVIIQPDLHAINYDKAVWGDNVEDFYPQSNVDRLPWWSFGAGARTCLGQRLVMLEAKTALVYLCRKFNFVATSATEKKLKLLMDGNSRELTSVYPESVTLQLELR